MNDSVSNALFQAIRHRDIDAVQQAIADGAHAGCALLPGGRTALMTAIREDFLPSVRVLLKGASLKDINAADAMGDTALIYAAAKDKPTILHLLIRRQADLDHQNTHGYTALIRAVRSLRIRNIRLLCKAGADTNKRDRHGSAAINLAAEFNRPDILDVLLAAQVTVDQKDAYGLTPLMRAAGGGSPVRCVKKLLDAGADANLSDGVGRNALMFAAIARNHEILTHLLEHGIDTQQIATSGETAEELAESDEGRAILRAWREREVLRGVSGAPAAGVSPQETPRRARIM